MILYAFLALVLASAALSVFRWRAGIWMVILLGALQDPVRKMIPGTPGILTLSTVPVWAGILVGALAAGNLSWSRFQRNLPGPSGWMLVFIFLLVPAAIMSLTYSPGSWQITLLGAYAYGSVLCMILLGMEYPRREGDLEKLLLWFVVINAIMLVGAPLERAGIGVSSGLTGTSSLGAVWVTYRTSNVIRMFSGFFRSPDVMGWHAAMVSMLCLILSTRTQGWKRYFLVAIAAWGGVGVMLCARRKMISAVAIFAVVFFLLLLRFGQVRRIAGLGLILALGIGGGARLYQLAGPDQGIEVFYGTIRDEALNRVYKHGVDAVLVTVRQAGIFGYGLGMAVQGAHHIDVARPNVWQESALDKAAAEIGVPGLLALIFLLAAFARAGHSMLQRLGGHSHTETYHGLAALLIANMASAVVSSQIYGDPYVGTILAFVFGCFFSGSRLAIPAPKRSANLSTRTSQPIQASPLPVESP